MSRIGCAGIRTVAESSKRLPQACLARCACLHLALATDAPSRCLQTAQVLSTVAKQQDEIARLRNELSTTQASAVLQHRCRKRRCPLPGVQAPQGHAAQARSARVRVHICLAGG